jgi:radical SAM-linked protein
MAAIVVHDGHRYHALVTYQKRGPLRFLGHLDLVRAFDRAIRRAKLPVKYSEGFAPRAQLSFPPPLPVGAKGMQELCVLELTEALDSNTVYKALAPQLKPFCMSEVRVEQHTRSFIWANLHAADYEALADFMDNVSTPALCAAIEYLTDATEITIERRTKNRTRLMNIRPYVYELGLSGKMVTMSLGITEKTMVKPAEVLSALGEHLGVPHGTWRQLIRTAIHFAS